MDKTNVIDMQGIVKRYYVGQPNELEILHGIDLQVSQNEFVAIVGESGSGKSTLMNMIGALDRPTEGTYRLVGQDISQLKDEQLSDIRNQEIGFIFQNFCLIPRMSAVRNVEIPLMYANMPPKQRRERAMELLSIFHMEEFADTKAGSVQIINRTNCLVDKISVLLSHALWQMIRIFYWRMNRRERLILRQGIWLWISFTDCMKNRIRQ